MKIKACGLKFILLVVLTGCNFNSNIDEYTELTLRYNSDNTELLDYYKDEINELKEIGKQNDFNIYSVQSDINDDGNMDYIATFESVIHNGTLGMPIDVLINDGNNVYKNIGGNVIVKVSNNTEITLFNQRSGVFKKICIHGDDGDTVLYYKKGHYILSE